MNKNKKEIIITDRLSKMELVRVTVSDRDSITGLGEVRNKDIDVDVKTDNCEFFTSDMDADDKNRFKSMIHAIELFGKRSPIDSLSMRALDTLISSIKKEFGVEIIVSADVTSIKKSHEKNIKDNKPRITFNEVIGMKDVKEKLYDVIDQFENADKYKAWNIKPIGGVLLYGPSGTGKSYISEALANEVDATFIKVSAGDIMSKYIGESGKNIKKIFEGARKEKRAIIYIDEIDFVASKRGGDENSKERNSTLNELLVQMASPDNDNIFMVFATNMKDLLDPAFLRSGRCDFKIEVPLPDFEARKGILESTSKGRPLADDVNFEQLSRNLSGMNCADVTHVSNEAARKALKKNQDSISKIDFDNAFEELICGASNGTKVVDKEEKTIVSIHESGHLIANEIFEVNKTKKISILPRGSALGFVLHANDDKQDKFLYSELELRDRVKVLLAGRAAEEITMGRVSTGASNDLEKATKLVYDMVCKYGYDEDFGLAVADSSDIMLKTQIHCKVKNILSEEYEETKNMLRSHYDLLTTLSNLLMRKEELNEEEIEAFLDENSHMVSWRRAVSLGD